MANMTNSFEKEILDGITGVTQLTTPGTVYLAAFTSDPGEEGAVTNEVAGGSYARVSLDSKYSATPGDTSSNTAKITFPTATADWGTVTHVGTMKSGTSGTDDMMVWIEMTTPIDIVTGSILEFDIGDLTFNAD